MTADIKIKDQDLEYFKRMIRGAEKKSVRFANRTVKGIALRFFISARKHTGPGSKTKLSRMAKKHRIRPVVNLTMQKQHMSGQYWYKDRVNNKIFSRPRPISKRSRFNSTIDLGPTVDTDPHARIIPLKRAIKAYSKKKKKFVYIGTEMQRGLHDGVKSTRIRAAGAAKAGWIMGMKALGTNAGTNIGRITSKVGTTRWNKGLNPSIIHTNEVDYVSNISPGVVSISMNKAANWFKNRNKAKFDKMVEKGFK